MSKKAFLIIPLLIHCLITISDETDSLQADYWQQEVNYKINVNLNDETHELEGFIRIEYINNSLDDLGYIYFHLWPNAYKNENTAFAKQQLENRQTKFYFSSPQDKGYIDQLNFEVDKQAVKMEYHPKHIDICKLTLNTPLKSDDTIIITTPFHVKIPGSFSRLGHIGQSYQISQWYPKPAVYDKTGWHDMPYLDQGEFYSEFGSFDVKITLPKNYAVGATGVLKNEEELAWLEQKTAYTQQFIEKINEKEEVIPYKDFRVWLAGLDTFPVSSNATKTLRYIAHNVHDFAWFADKRYHVLKGEIELPDTSKTVTTWAMFTNTSANLWQHGLDYVNNATYFYSKWVGTYPYEQVTAVDGGLSAGGGMEYPMVTIISRTSSQLILESVIVHEVGHNWFYGILGSNERDHAWMDEGINTYYEERYFKEKQQRDSIIEKSIALSEHGISLNLAARKAYRGLLGMNQDRFVYQFQVSRHMDQAMSLKSDEFTQMNYYTMVYGTPAIILQYIREVIGEDDFDNAMQVYYRKWQFKHPYPEDFQEVLESETGKYLEWLFDGVIKHNRHIDYEIKKVSKNVYEEMLVITEDYKYKKITVVNKGKVKAPFSISAIKNGKVLKTIWYGGFIGKMEVLFPIFNVPYIDYDEFILNESNVMPDVKPKNNMVRTKGLFKRTEKIRFQPLIGLNNPRRTEITYTPLIGWNAYDKTMLGLGIYNGILFPKNVEYAFAPMYGTGSGQFVGSGRITFYKYPEYGPIFNYNFSVSGAMFTFQNKSPNRRFQKIAPSLNFTMKKPYARSPVNRSITFRSVYINKEIIPKISEMIKENYDYYINEINYEHNNTRVINPFSYNINLQQGDGFIKGSLEAKYKITYQKKNKGLDIRFFGGSFIYNSSLFNLLSGSYRDVDFRLSSWWGEHDYLFDHTYLARNEGNSVFDLKIDMLSQQIALRDGAFKFSTPKNTFGINNNDWLIAINLKTDLPAFVPLSSILKLYADIGTFANAGNKYGSVENIVYSAGINVSLIPEVFEIYLPFAFSRDIKAMVNGYLNVVASGKSAIERYFRKITFQLNINKLDPFKLIRTVSF